MRSARLDFADPDFPVTVAEVDDPLLPGPSWARIEVTAGGICGSDLHILLPSDGTGSPKTLPLVGFPMELGHEMGGVVVEAGPECEVAVGTRVAVDPGFSCQARGLEPCRHCGAGLACSCERFNVGEPPGFGLGFASGTGGGWSDQLVAHTTQLHIAPDGVSDAGLALVEPLSIAVHGLLRRPPRDGEPVLVVGAGTIGLAALSALRALWPGSEVTVLARHDHQADAATALGATRVVRDGDDVHQQLADVVGGRITGERSGLMVWGGFPYVVEAVGSPASVNLALAQVAQEGVVSLLGAIAKATVDLLPVWFKNVDLVGAFGYGVQEHDGESAHTFDRSLRLLAAGAYAPDVVVTHTFPLSDLREAVETAGARDRGAIKVQLTP